MGDGPAGPDRRRSYTPGWARAGVPLALLAGVAAVQMAPVWPPSENGATAGLWTPAILLIVLAGIAVIAVIAAGGVASTRAQRRRSGRGLRRPSLLPAGGWLAGGLPAGLLLAGVLLAGVLGMAVAGWQASQRLAGRLPMALEGHVLTLEGRVADLPQAISGLGAADGWRFVFELAPEAAPARRDGASHAPAAGERAATTPLAVGPPAPLEGDPPPRLPARLLVACYGMDPAPHVGERWSLTLRLRRPHGLMNPGGGDTALWMMEQDLGGSASCRQPAPRRLSPASGAWIGRARQALREAIDRHVEAGRAAAVLQALSLGDQNAVPARDWQLYRDTGVAHLLSVSGLHVTMFAWLAGALAGRLWRRSNRLCQAWPAPRAAMWIGVAAALLYALFSGWGVPARRTVLLLLILALLRQSGRRWPWGLSLLSAAAVVVLMDPWAVTQAGFWLSFCAVGLLMATALPAVGSPAGVLAQAWRAQWAITLGLAPLTLLWFQQLSLVGLIANAVAIPWVSYVITPLAMLGALWPPLWTVGAWMVTGLNAFLGGLKALPLAVWSVPWAPPWTQGLALAGAALLALPWPWRCRLAGAALCLPMLWPVVARPPPGVVEIWWPDVGQGGATLVRTARHTLVFDAGPRWGPELDAGQRVLLPMLRGLGDRRVDLLVVSHADQDHAGGVDSLRAALPVTVTLGAGGAPCHRGQSWRWDGVGFEILWPERPGPPTDRRRNAASCVLRIDAGGRRVLLTGDIEAPQEARLVALEGEGLRADVLTVPHHGSRTSSTDAFLRTVAPSVAMVQAGYLNRFGHPRPEVVERYRSAGVTLLNSVDCGAWRWRSDRVAPAWDDCERARRRRYWLPLLSAPTAGEHNERNEAGESFTPPPPPS